MTAEGKRCTHSAEILSNNVQYKVEEGQEKLAYVIKLLTYIHKVFASYLLQDTGQPAIYFVLPQTLLVFAWTVHQLGYDGFL